MARSTPIRQGNNRIILSEVKFQALSFRVLHRLTYEQIAKRQHVQPEAAYVRVQSALDIIQAACTEELRMCHK